MAGTDIYASISNRAAPPPPTDSPATDVVIVDPLGTEHVFPPGFDPQRAAGIVRRSLGILQPGTLDVSTQPRVTNADGSISTVRSISINQDGKEYLIPTVSPDGRVLSNQDAIALFRRTGKHLGVFKDAASATAYAQQLHNREAATLDASPAPTPEKVTSSLDTLAGLMPAIGGTVGGFVGKVPGARMISAGIGGAAGEGYKELFQHLAELPGAVADVSRNLIHEPMATVKGFASGAVEGGTNALKAGAIQAGAQGIGEGIAAGASKGARAVYRGYLKPSLSERLAPKANEIVDTAINEAIPISRRGVAATQQVIKDLRGEVSNLLSQSPEKVDLHQIADQVRSFAKARYFKPGVDAADYKAALAVADSIDQHASLGLSPGIKVTKLDVPLKTADDIKRALDTAIGENAFGVERGATKTTQKFARRTVRTAMEAKAPDIAPLNARESKLIDAAKAIAKAVEREANQNPIYGVKSLASTGVGMTVGGLPGAAAGFATRQALRPGSMTTMAILANRLSSQLGLSAASAARLANYVLSEQGSQ
jgi:hypothetical protein